MPPYRSALLFGASGCLSMCLVRMLSMVGHAIEFVGFALEHYGPDVPPNRLVQLERILRASFNAGFVGPGIALAVSRATGRPLGPKCPW